MKKIGILIGVLVLVAGGLVGSKIYLEKTKPIKKVEVTQDKYVAFELEVWDKIKENYWDKISDTDLSNLYLLATNKLVGKPQTLVSNDRNGVEKLANSILANFDMGKKKDLVATICDMVLTNLKPFSRSRLYSEKDQTALSNVVNNVNPGVNYFDSLGVSTTATDQEVFQAFEEKSKVATSSQEKATLKQAYQVLKNSDARRMYETSGVEPTIIYKLITPEIFYVHLTKFSPTSLDEFVRTMAKVDSGNKLDTLIFDLRDNIGGAIDSLPYFLGPFIGADQYAYQFYQQGNKQDYKTVTGWLNSMVRYNKVIILINENSQSSAEVMAAVLKKYNVGVVMGTTTRGWGTVEKVFPLETQIDDKEKFSVYLVHHITLRDDGQPIEGRGVEPMISIKDPTWQKQLISRFNRIDIVKAVEEIYKGN